MVFEVVLYNVIGFESYFIFCGSELAKFQVPLIACGGVYIVQRRYDLHDRVVRPKYAKIVMEFGRL